MEDKFSERRIIALKVESARLRIGEKLSVGTITTEDLVWLLKQGSDYGLVKVSTAKEKLLQEIFNAPFLLCDQDMLDLNLKKLLPAILRSRYTTEVDELTHMRNSGLISKEELKEKRNLLKYCYYYTSEEGQHILRREHVKNVKDNVIRVNKVLKI